MAEDEAVTENEHTFCPPPGALAGWAVIPPNFELSVCPNPNIPVNNIAVSKVKRLKYD
jgi:hypothetical protein